MITIITEYPDGVQIRIQRVDGKNYVFQMNLGKWETLASGTYSNMRGFMNAADEDVCILQ